MKKVTLFSFFLSLLLVFSCSPEGETLEDLSAIENSETLFETLSSNISIQAKRPRPTIWADCLKFSGIVVPAEFKPTSGNFDELYVMPGHTFMGGVMLISDSKPGDQDYNGGRWHMNVLKDGVDPAIYADACRVEDLDLNDFESTPSYFSCPMKPLK